MQTKIQKWGLRALLRKVTRCNLHGQVSTGKAVGREAW
jgi:antitoxin component of MazEF toxin-antitoxin module